MLKNLIEWIIHNGGLYFLLLVVFAETGLFVGFFLPGDSLLFAAGLYSEELAREFFGVPIGAIILMVIAASILGSQVGYWFGRKYGVGLYKKKDSLLFKKAHLMKAEAFYNQYGKGTVFLSKFLPLLRTFAPIVAGMVRMPRATFLVYNVLGSVAWVSSMMLSGHYLQGWVENKWGFSLKDHIEAIAIIIVLVTTVPVLLKIFFGKKSPIQEVVEDVVEDQIHPGSKQ